MWVVVPVLQGCCLMNSDIVEEDIQVVQEGIQLFT